MRLDEALRQGIELLERGGVPSPRIAAEVLLMHAAGADRTLLYGHPERELADTERIHYGRYLHERLSGRPTQYITGRQEFWGMEFRVNPSVLIPRPETEHVVETALSIVSILRTPHSALRIGDVGTGSGCIAVALAHELPEARIVAGDISPDALATAAGNARRLAMGDRVHFFRGDLLECLSTGSLDLVVSNPPYVGSHEAEALPREVRGFEPPAAVFAGEEGLETYRRLVPEAARVLRPGGWVVLELGYNVAEKVRSLFVQGWNAVQTALDLAGIERVISARKAPAAGSAGVSPASRWRSRGYLSHFEGGSIPQFVTFRMADSLPSELLEQGRAELQRLPEREASAEMRRRAEQWLDQGAGHAWLRDARVASVVEEALLRFDGQRYQLHAWVVMPNHVHVLLTPADGWSLSAILDSWKSFTSKRANRILGRDGKFWQEEYFDRYIRDQQHFERAVEYIEGNPVKAGLCELQQQWRFGSATLRAGGTPALPGEFL